ncbi:hypothetical protein PULV_a1696 [Pseudoalteromonas ulvae UL12]|uniref:hypothetical protein n=1 Tax=Pseudoalteromonas ulvae TaxID=107327 RepID=UPI00186BA3AE|nr:hypothetical protein [Pseudoalteromonas ulvae]MBE0364130.1 hypothetical protein [Pseudoalteromonas ulvae UL12]
MTQPPISINQRYKSSTRIDSNNNNLESFIDDFILHGTAVNVLDTISRDFFGNEQRAYTLTGPYGSGKSTVALFLSCLLSSDTVTREYASNKLSTSNGVLDNFGKYFQINKGWKVIKHVCGLESPANAILISVYKALGLDFDLETALSMSDEKCLKEIKHAFSIVREHDGVLLLLDEMGKALDYQSRANKDLHLFQALADIVQQAKVPVLMLGFLHQSFSDYAKNKDVKAQKEWAKVQGRYRDLSFNPSIDESLVLVGDSITKHAKIDQVLTEHQQPLIDLVVSTYSNQSRNGAALAKTLPLDPLVSLLLGPISRRRFSQNERSLFGFLASHEKLGFRDFLAQKYSSLNPSFPLYRPELFWDYLHHNLHHLIVTSHDSKAWLEGCDAIYRAEQKGSDLHVILTKTIALLTIFGFHHHLHAKRDFITQYAITRGFSKHEVTVALAELESWTVIIYRQKHDALFVFQGSDIDINNLVLERVEAVSQGVDWTTVCNVSQNILATAHYHKTGTMRWANTLLVNKFDNALLDQLKATPLSGQSFMTFLLPANPKVNKELKAIAEQLPYTAIGQSDNLENLKLVAIELIALQQIAKSEEKINHDLIAKNELENRIKQASQQVETELATAFRLATWTHENTKLDTLPLTVNASRLADKIFHGSPSVINELVNRSKPSGSANSAIRKLMDMMFKNGDKEDLSFDNASFPPEKGLYLSCLKSKGWHCKTDEGFLFPQQWDSLAIKQNPKMHALWQDGIEFIKRANGKVTLADLYTHWMKPPFGLTAGLCRIYGLALIKSLEGQIAFYDFDSSKQFIFIPELDEELVNKIYKHPSEAAVQYFEISEIQTHLIDTLAKATIGNAPKNDAILGIAKHIVKIVHTLPPWVKKTSGDSFSNIEQSNGLTKEARAFRNKVIAATDPYKLILNDLPEVFGLDNEDKLLDEKLSHRLRTAIEDLSGQHEMLLSGFKQIIASGLGANFDQILSARCELVINAAQRPNIKEFANRLIKFISGKSSFELIINLGTGTPERNWTDKHIRNALDEIQNLCVQFRRIESFGSLISDNVADSKPLAFMTKNKAGNLVELGGFINFELEQDKAVKSAQQVIESSLSGLNKDQKLAAITNLLAGLMDEIKTETSNG